MTSVLTSLAIVLVSITPDLWVGVSFIVMAAVALLVSIFLHIDVRPYAQPFLIAWLVFGYGRLCKSIIKK